MAAETRHARVERCVDHIPGVRSLFLRLPRGEGIAFRPGQFLSVQLPVGGATLTRAYSIASGPSDPELLEICVERVPGGAGASAHLLSLAPGADVGFTGPWGTFVLDRAPDAEVVFVAEGAGIAPIRPMLHRAVATASHAVHLLHGFTIPLWHAELAALRGVDFIRVPPDALEREVACRWVERDEDRTRLFFLCGIGDRVLRLRDLLRAAGYPRRAVQYERW